MEFEWDPAKARANVARHGITFETAKTAFQDIQAIEILDDDSSEERWRLLGRAGTMLVMVVYTERGGRIRIISARKATTREQKVYLEQSQ